MTEDWFTRRRALLAASLAGALVWARLGDAQEAAVPVAIQAALMVKVAGYDKNLAVHAGDRVSVVVVIKSGNAESVRAAGQMRSALGDIPKIAGLPHDETFVEFADAPSLAAQCRAARATIVYIGPGLNGEIGGIRRALAATNVLTVGGVPEYVPGGIVLGFGLQDGKAKLLINLPEARKQNVAVWPEVVRLMTVYE